MLYAPDLATTHVHLTEELQGPCTLFTDRLGDSAFSFSVVPRRCNGVPHDVHAVMGPLHARAAPGHLLSAPGSLAQRASPPGVHGLPTRDVALVAALLDFPGKRVWLPDAGWVAFSAWLAGSWASKDRKFKASDDQLYTWRRCKSTLEWTVRAVDPPLRAALTRSV